MLPALLALISIAFALWLVTPDAHRGDALALASLAALSWYDIRLAAVLVATPLLLFALSRLMHTRPGRESIWAAIGIAAFTAFFVWNKLSGENMVVLSSQGGIALLGISYVALKAAAFLVETARGTLGPASLREIAAWIAFAPTYPSGPITDFQHFRSQHPRPQRTMVLGGLERILFGLVKVMVFAHYTGEFAADTLGSQSYAELGTGTLLLGLYANSLQFYFNFAGYSDIAIGVSAIWGYDVEENFDSPLIRRNLVQLWQHWHMTLTRWLRTYLFVPISRRLMRLGSGSLQRSSIAAAQVVTMVFCGIWHGLSWNFALWGLLQALGLIWVGVVCKDVGRSLPAGWVRWWRKNPLAYGISALVTFNAFAAMNVFIALDSGSSIRYLRALVESFAS